MADPQKYERTYSFTDYQAGNPSAPLPGVQVDNELENVEQSLGEAIDAIKDVRRSDGKLKNGIVTADSLSPQVAAGVGIGALAAAEAAAASAEAAADSAVAAAASATAAGNSAVSASGYANNALASRNEASGSADDAAAMAASAATARDFAHKWATEAENVDVDDGVNPVGKSAYHWALVAEGAAAGALPDGSVTRPKIADGAVNSEKLDAETNGKLDASVRVDEAQNFDASQKAQGRSNLAVSNIGFRSGGILSNNGTDANNWIDVAPFSVAADDATMLIVSATTIVKRLDAGWAAGSGNGGLDAGSKAASTGYSVFAIGGPGVPTDVLLSTSFSAPTMPSGYTKKRYLGSIITSSAGNIRTFTQLGNYFRLATPGGNAATATVGTTSVSIALQVPNGMPVMADIQWRTFNASTTSLIYLRCPDDLDFDPANPEQTNIGGATSNTSFVGTISVVTNNTRQVAARGRLAGSTLDLRTRGWWDLFL